MSDEFAPTSPELPTPSGIVRNAKEFSDALTTDLTDSEIKRAFELIVTIANKWHRKWKVSFVGGLRTPEEALEELDKMEEEVKYELATRLDIYATVDATPVFEGKPPIVELTGALPTHSIAKYGMDHEKKTWEVQHATDRKEDYYGQRGKQKKKK